MGNIRFVVFHTGVETLEPYYPLMIHSQAALKVTNPGARYVVLTDKETAPALERDFEVEALAPSGHPLMRQYVEAQRAYEAKAEPGLVVLAATDCVAARDLTDSLRHNMAVTYRHRGRHLINNIAYVFDHDRAAWFLQRALNLMKPKHYDYWGDQESWQDALGDPSGWELINPGKEDGIRLAKPDGREIHLYPCHTHNYFSKQSGAINPRGIKAYLWHFKGPRKSVMVDTISQYILGNAIINFKRDRDVPDVYPMQAKMGRVERGKRNEDSAVGLQRLLGPEASQDSE